MIEVEQLLRDNAIPYSTEGKNVKRGNLNVKCPFCGHADPGMHMGINLNTGKWGCWRDAGHRGQNFVRLLSVLIPCSRDKAERLVEQYSEGIATASLPQLVQRASLLQGTAQGTRTEVVLPLSEFAEIVPKGPRRRFWDYLKDERGFSDPERLCWRYDLRCAITGEFRQRLILPYILNGLWRGWTARAIGDAELRYRANDPQVKQMLFNADAMRKGYETLYVVEGPLDALKVDFYGREMDVRAVALGGTSCTDAQVNQLCEGSKTFKRVRIMLDADAGKQALALWSQLRVLGAELWTLPRGVKDPGQLSAREVRALCV